MDNLIKLALNFGLDEDQKGKLFVILGLEQGLQIQNEGIHKKIDENKRRMATQIVHILMSKLRADENFKGVTSLLSLIIHDIVLESLVIDATDYVPNHKAKFDLQISELQAFGYSTADDVGKRFNEICVGYAKITSLISEFEGKWRFFFELVLD
ncbi:MAG: hypothetical protein KA052_03550 [Candidatus Pacebacteria bacterium]|nr:hypothetical protein [Candidatus Paceibacterota bacterium]